MTGEQWLPDEQLSVKPLRSFGAMMALAVLFPIHFFFLRKTALGVVYWSIAVTLGWLIIPLLITFVWWLVNLFLVRGWVDDYNGEILAARTRRGVD